MFKTIALLAHRTPNRAVTSIDDQTSIAATARVAAVALSGTVGLEQWVQHTQALEGRFPTYQELQDYIAKNSVDMPRLPRNYQHYGYDEATGNVVILENKDEKEGRRRELHLDPNE